MSLSLVVAGVECKSGESSFSGDDGAQGADDFFGQQLLARIVQDWLDHFLADLKGLDDEIWGYLFGAEREGESVYDAVGGRSFQLGLEIVEA